MPDGGLISILSPLLFLFDYFDIPNTAWCGFTPYNVRHVRTLIGSYNLPKKYSGLYKIAWVYPDERVLK